MWYQNGRLVIAGLEDTLAMLLARGASEYILNRIRNSPPEHQGHYINKLIKNPLLNEYDLTTEVIQSLDKQKSNTEPSTPFEARISSIFVPSQQQWPAVYLKKLRENKVGGDFTYRGFGGGTLDDQAWNITNTFQQISDWARILLREDPKFQLAAYDFSQALNLSNEWHNMMAGKGGDKFYRPYSRDADGNIADERVVYQYADGWHISQVDGDDLTVEGNRMNHCVGGFCDLVDAGESRIFSLRDPRNQPKVTVEMDGASNIIKQIKANSDQVPEQELRLRLKEWFQNLSDTPVFETNDYEWSGPDWSSNRHTDDIRNNIYEEANGVEGDYDEESKGADYHSDYGVYGQESDKTRDITDLEVYGLLREVEDAMVGVNGKKGGFDYARESKYSDENDVFEALTDVIISHDTAILKNLLTDENSLAGSYFDPIFNPENKTWNMRQVRDKLGVFDLADKYNEEYSDYYEDTTPKYNELEQLSEESDSFRLYYKTILQLFYDITPEINELYKQFAGISLTDDLNNYTNGQLKIIWSAVQHNKEKAEHPVLMLNQYQNYNPLPSNYHDFNKDNEYGEGGWKYSKFKGWYKTASS